MSIASLNGNKYFVLFIDDLTRITWVYFLKAKFDVLNVFKELKKHMETQSGCVLKVLRTDNREEYTSLEFQAFYREAGCNTHPSSIYIYDLCITCDA